MRLATWYHFFIIVALVLAFGAGLTALVPAAQAAAASPGVTGISPTSAMPPWNGTVIITGTGFTADSGAWIEYYDDEDEHYDLAITGWTSTSITGTIEIPADASVGSYDVYVDNDGDDEYLENGFTVGGSITGIEPASGKQGNVYVVTITGTDFITGTWYGYIRGGKTIDFDHLVWENATTLSGRLTIPTNVIGAEVSPPGSYNVWIRDEDYTTEVMLPNGFTILGPIIDGIEPRSGKQGETLEGVIITGRNFTGATVVTFSGTGITATITAVTDSQITANVTIASDTTPGSKDLAVTTPDGTDILASTFQVTLRPSCGWVTMDVGPKANLASIALGADGLPHIAYTTGGPADDLMYVSYNGSAWGTPVTIDDVASYSYPSLAFDSSGNPSISYKVNSAGTGTASVKYAWRTAGVWYNVTVDSGDSFFANDGTSLAVDGSGHPHIIYWDYTNKSLIYATCTGDPSIPGNWAIENVTNGGKSSSIALDGSGNPHISYTKQVGYPYPMYYIYKSAGSWTVPDPVGINSMAVYSSLALDNDGHPHIACQDGNDGTLRHISKEGAAWSIQDLTPTGHWGKVSLALDNNGVPRICYFGETGGEALRYYNGSIPGIQVVDGGRFSGIVSLALERTTDTPHIAYVVFYTDSLKYAYYVPPVTPTVTTVLPASGDPGHDYDVTITGDNFTMVGNVGFGAGITCTFTIDSATQITAHITIASGAETGARTVSVISCAGTGTGTFTVGGSGPVAPTITSITPNSGANTGTISITNLAGTNFTSGATVKLTKNGQADISGTSVAFVSSSKLTCTFPLTGAATGTWNVMVTNPDTQSGTLTNGFTVTATPPPPPPPPTPPNPLIGTGAPTSHGGSGGVGTTNTQTVSLSNIQTQNASLSAKTVTPGTSVTVTADIANRSTSNGSKKVTLYVNGQVESTQGIAVNSGGSTKLTFNVSRSEPGDYMVYVDGVPAGSFKVELFRESDIILIFSVIMLAGAFVVGMIMLRRRQQYY